MSSQRVVVNPVVLFWPIIGVSLAVLNGLWTQNLLFAAFVLALPFGFALLVVGAATRLRIWTWNMPLLQVALLWTGCGGMGAFVMADAWPTAFTVLNVGRVGLAAAVLAALIGTVVDAFSIEDGTLEVSASLVRLGPSPVNIVRAYSFQFFGAFGLVYGVVLKVVHELISHPAAGPTGIVLIFAGALSALCAPFFLLLTHLVWIRGERGQAATSAVG